MNPVTKIAASRKRDYITPEDVSDALRGGASADLVRLAVLEVLGKQTSFGAEDPALCAFIAHRAQPSEGTALAATLQGGEANANWTECGAFPLAEIAAGRRACRAGWRDRGEGFARLAVVACSDGSLGLEREWEESFDTPEPFSNIADMLATDWFLEPR